MDVINVKLKKYGAKGDGIADDTVAVRNALADAFSQQKTLYFPTGTYLVDLIDYGVKPEALQISIRGEARNQVKIKKKSFDSDPILRIGATNSTEFTANILIENLTFEGIFPATIAAVQCYDLVRSKFLNCAFTNSAVGLELNGGIANQIEFSLFDKNQLGVKLQNFASKRSGGYPNFNTFRSCQMVDNTMWGVWFDGGRMLKLEDCDIEGNGTSQSNYGGIYVGPKVGIEVSINTPTSTGVIINGCWLEANRGKADIWLDNGKNTIRDCLFFTNANENVYDIYIVGGNYILEGCHSTFLKTPNVKEEAAVLTGNIVDACEFHNLSYDATKTTIRWQGRQLLGHGEVPVVYQTQGPMIQHGADWSAGIAGIANISFPQPFKAGSAPMVFAQIVNDSGATIDQIEVYDVTSVGFTARKKCIESGLRVTVGTSKAGIYWFAIGPKP